MFGRYVFIYSFILFYWFFFGQRYNQTILHWRHFCSLFTHLLVDRDVTKQIVLVMKSQREMMHICNLIPLSVILWKSSGVIGAHDPDMTYRKQINPTGHVLSLLHGSLYWPERIVDPHVDSGQHYLADRLVFVK